MINQDRIKKEKALAMDDEIDLIDLLKTIWAERKLVLYAILITTLLGLMIALFTEKEYEASTTMVPQIESQSSRLGGLSSLASLAGFDIDMNSETGAISPMLYPKIISSANFQLEIMNTEFVIEELEAPISLLEYYGDIYRPGLFGFLKKYTLGLPGVIKEAFQGDQADMQRNSESEIIQFTLEQYKVRKILEDNLSLIINDQEGSLTLISRFHQASLSAQVAKKSRELLQEYLTKFKIEKAEAQLAFVKERYEENKSEFEEAQSRLATFRDANKNISSEIMRTQEERLENEYQLAFDVYSELAKQMEQSMIKVEENTPVFSVIKEVVVPIEKSKPKRMLILVISVFLGTVFGVGLVVGRELLSLRN